MSGAELRGRSASGHPGGEEGPDWWALAVRRCGRSARWLSGDKRGRLVRENAGERAWVVRAERLASGPGKAGRTGLTSGPGGARSWLAGRSGARLRVMLG